tara:strand:- start:4956 stop:6050 length:1095 start_codon:yes stop_codon:yes gene_type:complete
MLSSIKDIKNLISNSKINKILIISGKNSFYKTGADKYFSELLKKYITYLYLKKEKLPEFKELKKIIKIKENFKPDLIIAVGGGCAMDLAKISSVFELSSDFKSRIINSEISKKKTKLLAIPTTAGSGAEVTSNAVIYINNLKYSVENDKIKPDYFCLLPELLLSSTKQLDATAGFDAVSQAVESLFSRKSNSQSILFAKKALKILLNNEKFFSEKKSLFNAHKMALGANLSGKAINISKTIAPHALSYSFTTMYGIPHGHAVSLSFNKFLKFNFFNQAEATCDYDLKKRYDVLFKITNTKNIQDLDFYFKNFKKKLRLEQDFIKLGINLNRHSSKIFSQVNEQRLKNNPIKLLKSDISNIFKNY